MISGSVYDVVCTSCGFRAIGNAPAAFRLDTCPCCEARAEYSNATVATRALLEAHDELASARAKFAPMHSPHEGYAVIREELERELWEHVCANTGQSAEARAEAIQVAAMALRYVVDLCEEGEEEAS